MSPWCSRGRGHGHLAHSQKQWGRARGGDEDGREAVSGEEKQMEDRFAKKKYGHEVVPTGQSQTQEVPLGNALRCGSHSRHLPCLFLRTELSRSNLTA
jgi:hypothetical protein